METSQGDGDAMLKGMTPSFCHGCGHYECVCVMDSTGKPIRVGDTVRFRGKNHTIKEFILDIAHDDRYVGKLILSGRLRGSL